MPRRDYRGSPVRKMVVIGESNAFGMNASDPRNEWVQAVANLIRDFQEGPLQVVNNAIPANVISRRSPGYSSEDNRSLPTALDRYREDLIMQDPDLAVIAYGLNDSRCGYPAELFLQDYEQIVRDVRNDTDALVVLTGPYWNTQHDVELWSTVSTNPNWVVDFGKFSKVGRDLVVSYVAGIRDLAERAECLFVDVFSPFEGSSWLLTDDHCHYSDIGQRVLGLAVFQAIAANCSFIGTKSLQIARQGDFTVRNTGGTQGMSRMNQLWRGR